MSRSFSLRVAFLAWLTASLPGLPQDDRRNTPSTQGPIRNWTFQHFQRNEKTGNEELIANICGEEMVPVDMGKKIFDVRNLKAQYYTAPTKSEKTQRVDITGGRARFDDSMKQLHLTDGVRIVTEDGAVLTTQSLTIFFDKRQFTTDEIVRVERKDVILTGKGLLADDKLKQITLQEQGYIEISGQPSELIKPTGKPKENMLTKLWSNGPMIVTEMPGENGAPRRRASVLGRGGVTMQREDPKGRVEMDAETVDIEIRRETDPTTRDDEIKTQRFKASGKIRMFDNKGAEVTGERLDWDDERGVANIEGGSRVTMRRGGNRFSANRAVVTRVTEDESGSLEDRRMILDLEGDVDANVLPDEKPDSRPIHLTCRTLRIVARPNDHHAGEGAWEARNLEACDDVIIEGLSGTPSDKPGKAHCRRFTWDMLEKQGSLEGQPYVLIDQGENRILAPKIVVSASGGIVIQGEKRFFLVQDQKRYSISAAADISMDPEKHLIRLTDRCSISSTEFSLRADRIDVHLTSDNQGVTSITASGRISARRPAEGANLFGDRMVYDISKGTLDMFGTPHATLVQRDGVATMGHLRYREKDQAIELFRGKERLRFIEPSQK